MKVLLSLTITLLFIQSLHAHTHSEAKSDFLEYCQIFKYPVQTHSINTADGYILTFYRIQAKNQTSFKTGLPVIYFQHGILDSADTWVVNSEPDSSAPGFRFANLGYDVWFGNVRGNYYSRKHSTLDPADPLFWEFTWEDMANYDLPAAFEYIGKYTEQKINYVSHSQGSTIMFVALSEQNPVVKKYINKFVALGPVAYLTNCNSRLLTLLAKNYVGTLVKNLKIYEFLPRSWFIQTTEVAFCRYFNFICGDVLSMIADHDPKLDNMERLDVMIGHFPSGTSTKDLIHYAQSIRSHGFSHYDYGSEENMRRYNTTTAPSYDLSKIDIPVNLFVGTSDELADPIDARRLRDELTGSPHVFYKEYNMGHLTFVWGRSEVMEPYLLDLENILKN